ncbi:MAG: YHYH protein [Rhodospirillaceae bacterium]|jgi:hypothetical protein|nr:YHYH protein [Rhodospirillaceae bacterium]MBT3885192.1 YHYH protein [Rhodospirillaceae bacterium]MBT4674422.1 YHYH protein [Rhodospirillaceae bacterium]MBT5181494.1 YHYH protein [Rhodospirillaceae bacterium]MBT6290516.1 YHYH protein [Rhodospirillaceae bacterium]
MRPIAISLGALLLLAGCVASSRATQDKEFAAAITDTGCAQAKHFLEVSKAKLPAGQQKPFLRAGCTGDQLIVQSNGIPNFEFVPVTPNPLQAQNYTWRIPRHPRVAAAQQQVPLLGPIAVAVNGLPIFGPNEAPQHGTADPLLDQLLDFCSGHTARGGVYHFHVMPRCLFDSIDGRTSLVVGYAFDGYPILAPWECTDRSCQKVRKIKSSWRKMDSQRHVWRSNKYQAGAGDLDRCNGMTRPDGTYAYYATDKFPYFLSCYHGEASFGHDGARRAGPPPGGGIGGRPPGPPPRRPGGFGPR